MQNQQYPSRCPGSRDIKQPFVLPQFCFPSFHTPLPSFQRLWPVKRIWQFCNEEAYWSFPAHTLSLYMKTKMCVNIQDACSLSRHRPLSVEQICSKTFMPCQSSHVNTSLQWTCSERWGRELQSSMATALIKILYLEELANLFQRWPKPKSSCTKALFNKDESLMHQQVGLHHCIQISQALCTYLCHKLQPFLCLIFASHQILDIGLNLWFSVCGWDPQRSSDRRTSLSSISFHRGKSSGLYDSSPLLRMTID